MTPYDRIMARSSEGSEVSRSLALAGEHGVALTKLKRRVREQAHAGAFQRVAETTSQITRKYREENTLQPPEPSCSMLLSAFGPLAQLGERLVRNQEVGGSIPPRSTNS